MTAFDIFDLLGDLPPQMTPQQQQLLGNQQQQLLGNQLQFNESIAQNVDQLVSDVNTLTVDDSKSWFLLKIVLEIIDIIVVT